MVLQRLEENLIKEVNTYILQYKLNIALEKNINEKKSVLLLESIPMWSKT